MKKALVISGGGSLGSWGGGTIEALKTHLGREYDLYVCTSTGSLLAPQSALSNFSKLKEAYTTVNQKSIFDVNPFTKKGKINFLNAIWRVICGKKTLGESKNLRKRIEQFFTEEDFISLKERGKEIVVTVVNVTTEKEEYKSSKDYNYCDFCDWMWASACSPVFMTLVKKDGFEYVDGGIVDHIPIQYAIEQGAEEIDVIIHRTREKENKDKGNIKDIFDHFQRIVGIMHHELSEDDVLISGLQTKEKDVTLRLYYLPYKLTNNSLVFNTDQMNKWWDLGLKGIRQEMSYRTIVLTKEKQ